MSITSENSFSECSSKYPIEVAPALANIISTWSVDCDITLTSLSSSSAREQSAGTAMAFALGCLLGNALRSAMAFSQSEGERDVIKT